MKRKTIKVKDPRKVELGKRLAKISKRAKECKKRLREVEKRSKEIFNTIDFKYVVGGVTILGGIAGLYFAFKRDKREIEEEEKENKKRCDIDNL